MNHHHSSHNVLTDATLWYPSKKMKAAATEVATIHPKSDYDIIDLTGDDPNTINKYVRVSVDSSVVVELIDDLPFPVVHIPIIASDISQDIDSDTRHYIQTDSIGNARMQETSRHSSFVETDVLRQCKSTLELFAEVTRGVIISLNHGRTLLQQHKVQRIEWRLVATDDILCEHQRCVRCLESLLIASAFETKTVAYDRRINETSVRALIKRAYSMFIESDGMRRLVLKSIGRHNWRACHLLVEGRCAAALEAREYWTHGNLLLDNWSCIKAMMDPPDTMFQLTHSDIATATKVPLRSSGRLSSGSRRSSGSDLQEEDRGLLPDAASDTSTTEQYQLCVVTLGHWCDYLRMRVGPNSCGCEDAGELWSIIGYCLSSVRDLRQSGASGGRRGVMMRRLLELASILFDETHSQQGYISDLELDDRLVELFRVEMFPAYKQWHTEYKISNKLIPDLPYIFSSESKQEIYACHMLHKLSGELRVIAHWMDLLLDKVQTVGMLLTQAHMYTMRVLDILRDVDPSNTKRYLRSIASDVVESQVRGIFQRAKVAVYRGQHEVDGAADGDRESTEQLVAAARISTAVPESMNRLHQRLSKNRGLLDSIDGLPVLNDAVDSSLGISTRHHPHLEELLTFLSLP